MIASLRWGLEKYACYALGMCGRYVIDYTWDDVNAVLALGLTRADELRVSYNVAPTQSAPVVRRASDGMLEGVMLTWGLIPSWSRDDKPGPINARAETVASNGMFRSAFTKRRCLVPVSGFYEWQQIAGSKIKQPWYISSARERVLLLAGLWERRGDVESYTIITTTPNALMTPIHNRMPVVLDDAARRTWLRDDASSDELLAVLTPARDGTLRAWHVSTRVNKPSINDRRLIDAVS